MNEIQILGIFVAIGGIAVLGLLINHLKKK